MATTVDHAMAVTAMIVVWLGVGYCITDFIVGVVFKRCVLPGLKCPVCRRRGI